MPILRFILQRKKASGTNLWYISSMNLEHVNCTATAKPTQRQIESQPTFAAAVIANPKLTANDVITQLQTRDGINVSSQKRTVYRARQAVMHKQHGDLISSYTKLPSLLHEFAQQNSGSVVAHENDIEGPFAFHMFL